MNVHRLNVLALAALLALAQPVAAQWQTPNHSVPVGKGGGNIGFDNAAPGTAGIPLTSTGPTTHPAFGPIANAGMQAGADGTVKGSSGGNVVDVSTSVILNTACGLVPSVCTSLLGYTNVLWYGAKCDGSTDDTSAIQNAITATVSGRVVQPANATCVITAHLNGTSGLQYAGAGRGSSALKQTGKDYFFNLTNVSGVDVGHLTLLGTDSYTSWAAASVGAFVINASTPQSDIRLHHLKLQSMNATYWIEGTQTALFTNLVVEDNWWVTSNADVPTDANPLNNTNFAITLYSGSGGVRWENTVIRNNRVDGDGLCFGFAQFGNHYKYRVQDNALLNIGGTNLNSHCTNSLGATNAYGVLVYDTISDGNPPGAGIVSGNLILNPIASGIYFAGDGVSTLRGNNSAQSTTVEHNLVVGQSSSDSLLPRAAVSVNSTTDITVSNNAFYNNQNCVYVTGQNTGDVSVLGNHCVSIGGGALGIIMGAGNNGSSNSDIRTIKGNLIDVTTAAVVLSSGTGRRFNVLDISDNTIIAHTGQLGINAGNQFVSGIASVTGNVFRTYNATAFNFGGLTGLLELKANSIYDITNATAGITFSNLPAAINGSDVYVSDGTVGATCTGGGTGSNAVRQNGVWKCL